MTLSQELFAGAHYTVQKLSGRVFSLSVVGAHDSGWKPSSASVYSSFIFGLLTNAVDE